MSEAYIDDIMSFDSSNLDVFQEKPKSAGNENIYRTNPKLSKAEDGHYRSRVRVIYNPYNVKRSVVPCMTYAMTDENGFFLVRSSLADGDRNCPIFKSWKKLHFSGDETKKEWAKKMYNRNESQWVLVQILEDNNQPDLVGQVKAMKLPRAIFNKMSAKMNPSAESGKVPVPVMDYLIGLPLEIDVTPGPDDPKNPERKQREISYDLCDFDAEYAPIIKIDGTPLFTDEELETIDAFDAAKKKVNKAKTETAKAAAQTEVANLTADVKALYQKALNYLKDEAKVVDLDRECGYRPWTQEMTARVDRWIERVLQMQDPMLVDINEIAAVPATETVSEGIAEATDPVEQVMNMNNDDLPF